MLQNIHKNLITNRFILPIAILIICTIRLLEASTADYISVGICLLLDISTLFLILQIDRSSTIIRKRTILPALFYLLLIFAIPDFNNDVSGSLSSFCIVLSLLLLFKTYHKPEYTINFFNLSFVLSCGSLLWPPLILFFPYFLICSFFFRSLTIKSFLASIIGFCTVYLFVGVWFLYKEDTLTTIHLIPDFPSHISFLLFNTNPNKYLFLALLIFLSFISACNIILNERNGKIKTRAFLGALFFLIAMIFAFIFIFPNLENQWLQILIVPVSLVAGHFFSLNTSKKASCTFLATFCCCIYFFYLYR